ncbi:MAG: hypothetical protein K2K98_09490 [Muribaculaceae bacterium]|nr:hypothetical protein [Muribaculaceae bacterium]
MKKFLLILVCCLIGTYAYSQDDASWDDDSPDWSWMENAPGKYLPAMTKIIISADSPCNIDGEAFKDFIPRFRKDKAFRDSRLKLSSEMENTSMEWFDNFAILKASSKNTRCDKSFGTWFNVSADEVCFQYNDVILCNGDGGGSVNARFQRIDGKWYLTGLMIAG